MPLTLAPLILRFPQQLATVFGSVIESRREVDAVCWGRPGFSLGWDKGAGTGDEVRSAYTARGCRIRWL